MSVPATHQPIICLIFCCCSMVNPSFCTTIFSKKISYLTILQERQQQKDCLFNLLFLILSCQFHPSLTIQTHCQNSFLSKAHLSLNFGSYFILLISFLHLPIFLYFSHRISNAQVMTIEKTSVHKLGKGKEIQLCKLNLQFCCTIKFYPLTIMKQFGYRIFPVNQKEQPLTCSSSG